MTHRARTVFGALLLFGGAGVWWSAACERDSGASGPPSRAWPAGTAVAVDDVPISIEQIDADSVFVERIGPAAASAQLRRLALTNLTLPRALAQAMNPGERARVFDEARAARAQIATGSFVRPPKPDGTLGEVAEGDFTELGLVVWGTAMDLGEGEWSDVLEEPGRFVLVRRLERRDGPVPMATVLRVDALVFPWIHGATAAQDIEVAFDHHVLTIVDPAFESIVPELIKVRMRPKQP